MAIRNLSSGPAAGALAPSHPRALPLENGDRLTRSEFERANSTTAARVIGATSFSSALGVHLVRGI